MAKILLINGDNIKALDEAGFGEESKLQDYLEKYPSLVPLEDVVEEAPELICIGKEVEAMDLLFIDKDGLLTVIETKLVKNPEMRREVIGQILEYASYVSQWTVGKVYEKANAYVKGDFDSFMLNKYPTGFSVADFKANIEKNLRDGKIQLIVAVDKLIESLRQLVTFLNSHSDLKILLLEVSSFEGKTKEKVLAPKIFGYAAKTPERERRKILWGEEDFFTDAREKCEPMVVDTITRLYEFTKSNANAVNWGIGANYGSFTFRKSRYGVMISFFTVQSDGRMYISFGGMKSKVKKETLHSFRIKLNKIPNLKIPEDAVTLNKYPYMKVEIFAKPDSLEIFEDAVLFLCRQIETDYEGKNP